LSYRTPWISNSKIQCRLSLRERVPLRGAKRDIVPLTRVLPSLKMYSYPPSQSTLGDLNMLRKFSFAILALGLGVIGASQIQAANKVAIQAHGIYVEARTTDVWTGPCFANADFNIGGKQGVMAWRIEKGQAGDVNLDGLSVVAVVVAGNTLGLDQRSPAKAIIIVDKNADSVQREALVRFAQQQGG